MKLPELEYQTTKNQLETVSISSINFSDNFQPGEIADSENISARRYPYITTRKGRTQYGSYASATALTSWNGQVVVVDSGKLYVNGVEKGSLTAGAKQFAVVNTKVVIWPDKKYYDISAGTLNDLGASVTGTTVTFTGNTITATWSGTIASLFKAGDGINISGSSITANNTDCVISSVSGNTITVTTTDTFTSGTCTSITMARVIPDMDFICESENRLWGCNSTKQTIYASALGDPTNFNVFEGLASDSYALAVGTSGSFTACCKYGSTVLFFKEDKLHKMLGSYPKEYTLYTYDVEGVQSGSHKSLQVINQALYYKGVHGVFTYGGGTPSLISSNFGEKIFTAAVGGEDGDTYYISLTEGSNHHLLCYETTKNLWVREGSENVADFTTIGNTMYALIGGKVYQFETSESVASMDWSIKFKPFYETIKGRKLYSKIILRMELPQSSKLKLSVAKDGGLFRTVARYVGKNNNAMTIRLPINRCDKYEIKLEGTGEMAILEMLREVMIGSDV